MNIATVFALTPIAIAGCTALGPSSWTPELAAEAPTRFLCDTYYFSAPRSQVGAQNAKSELIRRGETKCIEDAEPPKKEGQL